MKKASACFEKSEVIEPSALPLACPTPTMTLWNAHPKVYLPIEATGQATCPYCGTHFVLKHD